MEHHSFAVVDTETTGFLARGSDRVIEVGVVLMDAEGSRRSEYATLINPGRDLGRTDIHGIRGSDVTGAPTFAEIVGDLSELLRGRILVAHNARFDRDFLASEFDRAGYRFPDTPWLCSMEIGAWLTGARALAACRDALGLDAANAHCALDDAEAAATLVERCLETAGGRTLIASRLRDAVPAPLDLWPPVPPSGNSLSRVQARTPRPPTYIAELLGRLPEDTHLLEGAQGAYLEVLDRALEDRRITPAEVDALSEVAVDWNIGRDAAKSLHKRYVAAFAAAAWEDGVVTDSERVDLEYIAGALGETNLLGELLSTPPAETDALPPARADGLEGMSVCFTGVLMATRRGAPITRRDAEQLASDAGLAVTHGASKKLDLLVVADPDSLSGKARTARDYGTRIIAERAFWREIGVDVD